MNMCNIAILYNFRDKWVDYYEVSKATSGSSAYNPSNTTYLWYYNNIQEGNSSNNCNKVLISNLHMTLYKLSVRYSIELENGQTLVQVGKDTNITNSSDKSIINTRDTVELLQLRLNRLQRSILSVADTLLLMDFNN